MLKIKLSDAILADNGWPSRFYPAGDWFMAYEWLCRKIMDFNHGEFEKLNATSSINNSQFNPIYDTDVPCERIAYLCKHGLGFWGGEVEPFLVYLGVRKWADLAKTISITGRRPKEFPHKSWFNISGRQLSYSPNRCHTKAIYVSNFSVQFCHYSKRWIAHIDYGYLHDSGWTISIEQNYREHLDSFAVRVNNWLADVLIPEDANEARMRQSQVRDWRRVCDAFKEIFYESDFPFIETEMTDLLMKVEGTSLTYHRIHLDKSRITTLKKWLKKQCGIGRKAVNDG